MQQKPQLMTTIDDDIVHLMCTCKGVLGLQETDKRAAGALGCSCHFL